MLVGLDDERLKSPLVDMSATDRVAMRVPALGVGKSQPADKAGKLAVLLRPNNQMPVVGHNAIGKQPHLVAVNGRRQHAHEGVVVFGLLEDRHSSVGAVEHMVNQTALGNSQRSSHAHSLANRSPLVNNGS